MMMDDVEGDGFPGNQPQMNTNAHPEEAPSRTGRKGGQRRRWEELRGEELRICAESFSARFSLVGWNNRNQVVGLSTHRLPSNWNCYYASSFLKRSSA